MLEYYIINSDRLCLDGELQSAPTRGVDIIILREQIGRAHV